MSESQHTLTPWRVGDAGRTVFGPPNGKPSPEIICTNLKRDNARLIAHAVNLHQELVDALVEITQRGYLDPRLIALIERAKDGA